MCCKFNATVSTFPSWWSKPYLLAQCSSTTEHWHSVPVSAPLIYAKAYTSALHAFRCNRRATSWHACASVTHLAPAGVFVAVLAANPSPEHVHERALRKGMRGQHAVDACDKCPRLWRRRSAIGGTLKAYSGLVAPTVYCCALATKRDRASALASQQWARGTLLLPYSFWCRAMRSDSSQIPLRLLSLKLARVARANSQRPMLCDAHKSRLANISNQRSASTKIPNGSSANDDDNCNDPLQYIALDQWERVLFPLQLLFCIN